MICSCSAEPTGTVDDPLNDGDIWYDTDNNNQPHIRQNGAWVPFNDLTQFAQGSASAFDNLRTTVEGSDGTGGIKAEVETARGGEANLNARIQGIEGVLDGTVSGSFLEGLKLTVEGNDGSGGIVGRLDSFDGGEITLESKISAIDGAIQDINDEFDGTLTGSFLNALRLTVEGASGDGGLVGRLDDFNESGLTVEAVMNSKAATSALSSYVTTTTFDNYKQEVTTGPTSIKARIDSITGQGVSLETFAANTVDSLADKAETSALAAYVTTTTLTETVTDENEVGSLAYQLNDVSSSVNDLSASGKFLASAVTTPAGATAAVELSARTDNGTTVTEAALRLISVADTGGVKSQVQVKANGFFVLDENDDPVTIVDATTGKLIASELLVTGGLSSISANAGTITAGKIRDANSKMIIDLDNAVIEGYE